MALPKLNDTPKYEIIIPSTQAKVRYRPYLVKEEKILMMALETKDQRKALSAIVDTIDACVSDELKLNELTTFDVEYMFTQIRSKSVGETSKILLTCEKEECGHQTEVEVPISQVEVTIPEVNKRIKLTDSISMEMQWPSYTRMLESDALLSGEQDADASFGLIASCIHSVQTGDDNILMKDEPKEEVQTFLESLTTDQFNRIRDFFDKMPKMEYKVEWVCEKCGHKNERTLSGINDFF